MSLKSHALRTLLAIAASAQVLPLPAAAQSFLAQPSTPSQWQELYDEVSAPFSGKVNFVSGSVFANLSTCPFSGSGIPAGCSGTGVNLPLEDFATQNEFNSLNQDLAALNNQLVQEAEEAKHTAWAGSVLAAALTPVLPQDGYSNHFNIGTAAATGAHAISFNYSHTHENFDVEVGLSTTGRYALGKISAGFSW